MSNERLHETNAMRIAAADAAIATHAQFKHNDCEPDQDRLVDLLSDLMHWAHASAFGGVSTDFTAALDTARMHFEAEIEGSH